MGRGSFPATVREEVYQAMLVSADVGASVTNVPKLQRGSPTMNVSVVSTVLYQLKVK
jgi:hypothetical protein